MNIMYKEASIKMKSLVVFFGLGLLVPVVQAESGLFNGTTPNAWVIDEASGKTEGTYNTGKGDWSVGATANGTTEAILHFDTQADEAIGNLDLNAQDVIINETSNSLPGTTVVLPPFSVVGLEDALSDADNLAMPGIRIFPASGTYDGTIKVRLQAVGGVKNINKVRINWTINGTSSHSEMPVDDANTGIETSFYLIEDGTYTVDYWATQGSEKTAKKKVTYIIDSQGNGGNQRDTDGDGVPDLVEVEFGLDPFEDDTEIDSDDDGWTDFEEAMRHSDPFDASSKPSDLDGDGWSDYDENIRGTDPKSKFSKPTARRLYEVEYLVKGAIYSDPEETILQSDMGQFDIRDIDGELLFEKDILGGFPVLGTRVPAGQPLIVTSRHMPGGIANKWAVKGWLDNTPDLNLTEMTGAWTSVLQWEILYESYLRGNGLTTGLYRKYDINLKLSPKSGLGVALIESILAWYADLSDGAFVLLGSREHPAPKDAVFALREALQLKGRSFNELHSELKSLTVLPKELFGFANTVNGFYADPQTFEEITTLYAMAALVQGGKRTPGYSYIARLLSIMGLPEIDALPVAERAALFDQFADSDNDGLANSDEIENIALKMATSPTETDSDGDLIPDNIDPCPADAENICMNEQNQLSDSDGDSIQDALDNCMNEQNTSQKDTNADGVGNDCLYYANIKTPTSNIKVWLGDTIDFSSIVTESGFGRTLKYVWNFAGGAPNSSAANPGAVAFQAPGIYKINLMVKDIATGTSRGSDVRFVEVIGVAPTVDAGGPYSVQEGTSAVLTANASSSVGGGISYAWSFSDGGSGIGNPLAHYYAQDGLFTAQVTVTDGLGATAQAGADITVTDTVPSASFSLTQNSTMTPVTVNVSDTSTAYDGIAAGSQGWEFDNGAGVSATGPTASHTYLNRGIHRIAMTVEDTDGSTDTAYEFLKLWSGFNLLTDTDGDKMPDVWEMANLTDPGIADASGDEGDGFAHLDEYRADTDPQDISDMPEGPAPVSYILYRDDFDDDQYDDRWSLGIESPMVNNSAVESAGSMNLSIASRPYPMPLIEACSATSLIGFGTIDGDNFVTETRLTFNNLDEEACMSLLPGTDLSNRVEVCTVGNGAGHDIVVRSTEAGIETQIIGSAVSGTMDWRLIRTGSNWKLYTQTAADAGPVLQASFSNAGLGNVDIRPMFSLLHCGTPYLPLEIESIRILSDADGDGLADLYEDTNQNGTFDTGESDLNGGDTDTDGIPDGEDTCLLVSDATNYDSNGDGFGNLCDADLDGTGFVNIDDLDMFKQVFFTNDSNADFDGSGFVNIDDLDVFKSLFFKSPGPSGLIP